MKPIHDTGMVAPAPLLGVAAGVPYVALPPTRRRRAPLVVAWPGLDPPRSQQAMAAALPLTGLAAWRVYLGLPLVGTRAPAGDPEELACLGAEDVVGKLVCPMVEQAFAEFPAVVAALRVQLKLDMSPIGLVGDCVGAAVALSALAEGEVSVQAAALVRPAVQLERVVANDHRHNPHDRWTQAAPAGAVRLAFLARADQIAARDPQPAVLLVTGAGDDAGVGEPAERLWQALADRYRDPGRVAVLLVPGLAQALAAEPGTDLAPQTPDAARVDAAITGWLGRHLTHTEP
jgi:dienelactone hydrolase